MITKPAETETKTMPRQLFIYSLSKRGDSYCACTGISQPGTSDLWGQIIVGGCPVAENMFCGISWPDARSLPPLVTIESVSRHHQMPPWRGTVTLVEKY